MITGNKITILTVGIFVIVFTFVLLELVKQF